jgi:hypothetical protein
MAMHEIVKIVGLAGGLRSAKHFPIGNGRHQIQLELPGYDIPLSAPDFIRQTLRNIESDGFILKHTDFKNFKLPMKAAPTVHAVFEKRGMGPYEVKIVTIPAIMPFNEFNALKCNATITGPALKEEEIDRVQDALTEGLRRYELNHPSGARLGYMSGQISKHELGTKKGGRFGSSNKKPKV